MKQKGKPLVEHTAKNTIRKTLGLGAVAGMRSMSAPALLSRAARTGEVNGLEGTRFAPLLSPTASSVLYLLAVGEMVADKSGWIPGRISPPALLGRAASGALVGAALFVSGERRGISGAALGTLAAVAAAYASYYARDGIVEMLGIPDQVLGHLEDGVVLFGGSHLMKQRA